MESNKVGGFSDIHLDAPMVSSNVANGTTSVSAARLRRLVLALTFGSLLKNCQMVTNRITVFTRSTTLKHTFVIHISLRTMCVLFYTVRSTVSSKYDWKGNQ